MTSVGPISASACGSPAAWSPAAPSSATARSRIVFDANGFTADQTIYLVHPTDAKMLWTIQLRGLTGQAEVVTDTNGQPHPLEKIDEGSF